MCRQKLVSDKRLVSYLSMMHSVTDKRQVKYLSSVAFLATQTSTPRGEANQADRNMSSRPDLPATGVVRLKDIVGPGRPIPVSKSTWWAGVRSGRYPAPVKLGPSITAWRVEDIRALIEHGGEGGT